MRKNICSVFLVLSFLAGLLTMPVRAFTIPQKPGDYLWQYTEGLEAGNGGSFGGGDSDIHVWVNNQSGDQPVRQLDVIVYSDGIRLGKQGAVVTLADGTVYQGRVTTYTDGFHISFPLDAPITGWYECFVSLKGENGSQPLAIVRLVNGSGGVSKGNIPYWNTAEISQAEADSVLSLVTVHNARWMLRPAGNIAGVSVARTASVSTIAASWQASLAILEDGSLWSWGCNFDGNLGTGSATLDQINVPPAKVMDGVRFVTADQNTIFAGKTDGSLWAFGSNSGGALGDGTTERRPSPVKIMDDAVAVKCQSGRALALTSGGELYGWGRLLGDTAERPRKIMDRVSVFEENLVITEDGVLWSINGSGYGLTEDGTALEPIRLMEGVVDVRESRLNLERSYVRALLADGSLWEWGYFSTDDYVPGYFGVISGYIAPRKVMDSVASLEWEDLVIDEDGTLWYLDSGANRQAHPPEKLLENVVRASYTGAGTVALRENGELWWAKTLLQPLTKIADGAADFNALPASVSHLLILKRDGSLWGKGRNNVGQLTASQSGQNADTPIKILDGVKLPEGAAEAPTVRPDVPSSWAQDVVSAAIAAGLVPENLQQNYTEAVSRGEVAEMFIRLLEKSSGKDINAILAEKGVQINPTAFTDTTDKNVLAANALGIINGVGNNRFDPNGTFTRAQIAAILNRTAEVLGVETDGYTHTFTDVSGHWVSDSLGWPVHAGIINGVGDNRFDPDGVLTTEQSIVMAQRALEALSISQ